MAGVTNIQTRAVGYHLRRWYFDDAKVKKAVGDTTAKVLSKFGSFVRKAAHDSIKDSNTISKPGKPPHSHFGAHRRKVNRRRMAEGLAPVRGGFKGIKQILFAWDPGSQSVVIGPILANQLSFSNDKHRRPVKGTVPEVLEYGGAITMMEVQGSGGRWFRADLRSRRRLAGRQIRYTTKTIRPRPYMTPAYQQEVPKLPGMWADAVK